MKFVIEKGTTEVDYKNFQFWQQIDELEVQEPDGWAIYYIAGGITQIFDYCQSTGGGNFVNEYIETEHTIPLAFTSDAKKNAEIMKASSYDRYKTKLIRETNQ